MWLCSDWDAPGSYHTSPGRSGRSDHIVTEYGWRKSDPTITHIRRVQGVW